FLCALIIEQRDECYYAEVLVCECFDAEVFADDFYYSRPLLVLWESVIILRSLLASVIMPRSLLTSA
ncbi:hypothetical protein H5410_021953, partial [Solanum commersonii]